MLNLGGNFMSSKILCTFAKIATLFITKLIRVRQKLFNNR